jgi:sugar lactone lactonase YvrE
MRPFQIPFRVLCVAFGLACLTACGATPSAVTQPANGSLQPILPSSETQPALSHGLLFVSDEGPNVVDIYSAQHLHGAPIGKITNGIDVPDGMVVDKAGNLYVTNAHGNTVQVYPPGGKTPKLTYTQGLSTPANVTLGKDGTMYVVNLNGGATYVNEYPPGHMKPTLTLNDCPGFMSGLAIDPKDRLYVSCHDSSGHGRVYRYAKGATRGTDLMLATHTPAGLLVDRVGNLVVADATLPAAIEVFPPGAKQPSQVVTNGVGNPFLISFNHGETMLFATDEYHVGVDVFAYPVVAFKFRMTGLSVPAGVTFSPAAH